MVLYQIKGKALIIRDYIKTNPVSVWNYGPGHIDLLLTYTSYNIEDNMFIQSGES